jgi:hypothetical protein
VVWLLGFTFATNNSPYFVTSAFLGDYLATLGKPELLGAALGWLNDSQLVAMVVLFLTANRLQMRAWPFLVFGPTMLAAFLVMMIFVTSSLAIVAATAIIVAKTANDFCNMSNSGYRAGLCIAFVRTAAALIPTRIRSRPRERFR